MVDERAWESLLREIMHHFRDVVQEHLEKFTRALRGWMIQTASDPLPADWRQQTTAFLAEWEQKGYHLSPQSIALVEGWIEGWAARMAELKKEAIDRARVSVNEAALRNQLQSLDGRDNLLTDQDRQFIDAHQDERRRLAEFDEQQSVSGLLDDAQTALDVIGIADPTGVADGANAALHLARGNYQDAGISAISMIPLHWRCGQRRQVRSQEH